MRHRTMTVEELADWFQTVSRQRVQQVLKKYEDRGEADVVDKLQQAKKLCKRRKYEAKHGASKETERLRALYHSMLRRIGKLQCYEDCTTVWTSEKEFVTWALAQRGHDQERFDLDKDILVKGNRVYGPDTCVFVPQEVNVVLSGCYRARRRGKYPIGVCFNKGSGQFVAQMSDRRSKGLDKYLGSFPTAEAAFACYKAAKEARIKSLANKWKDHIDPRAYDALMARTVEWDD